MATKSPNHETRHKKCPIINNSAAGLCDIGEICYFGALCVRVVCRMVESIYGQIPDSRQHSHIGISNSKLVIFESTQRPPPEVYQSLGHRLSLKLTPPDFTGMKMWNLASIFRPQSYLSRPRFETKQHRASWNLKQSRAGKCPVALSKSSRPIVRSAHLWERGATKSAPSPEKRGQENRLIINTSVLHCQTVLTFGRSVH